jgi:AcrR family transcriptional regulator
MATSAQARRWAKTGATQRRILDAATEVFATRGFAAATMADVVAASGASIGSIYHHFGGKNELFLAIFERMAAAVDEHIEAAMRQAGSAAGLAADPRRVFELHVRAYLEAMWENRRLAAVLTSGDAPPGFEVTRRDRMQAAFRHWIAVLELDKSVRGQLLSRILVATMAESSLMVAGCGDPDDVREITDAAIDWIARIIE